MRHLSGFDEAARKASRLMGGPAPSGQLVRSASGLPSRRQDTTLMVVNRPSGKLVSTHFTNPCPSRKESTVMGGLSPSGKAVSLRAWPGIRFPEGFLVDSDSTGLRPVRQAHWPVVERVPSGRVYNRSRLEGHRLTTKP